MKTQDLLILGGIGVIILYFLLKKDVLSDFGGGGGGSIGAAEQIPLPIAQKPLTPSAQILAPPKIQKGYLTPAASTVTIKPIFQTLSTPEKIKVLTTNPAETFKKYISPAGTIKKQFSTLSTPEKIKVLTTNPAETFAKFISITPMKRTAPIITPMKRTAPIITPMRSTKGILIPLIRR